MNVLVVDDSNFLRKRIIDSISEIPGYEISGSDHGYDRKEKC